MTVDNEIYNRIGHSWWEEDSFLYLLRAALNPARFGYFRGVLTRDLGLDPHGQRALDVGCGGGLLAEEFAQIGCQVTGIDPSVSSIDTARAHALQMGLSIDYRVGVGEALSFDDAAFDVVYCCDVLEHVADPAKVIEESARVLRPGGVFFYDTINRTLLSRLLIIGIFQELPWTRFAPAHFHEWTQFIKPSELESYMARQGLEPRAIAGLSPEGSPLPVISTLIQINRGRLTIKDLASTLRFKASKDTSASYMGYGLKRAR
jgi:2-polyprenyl-6-hydroxyphenyl methylase / 3-demethylubiquinone-9 3-methyltransferase